MTELPVPRISWPDSPPEDCSEKIEIDPEFAPSPVDKDKFPLKTGLEPDDMRTLPPEISPRPDLIDTRPPLEPLPD